MNQLLTNFISLGDTGNICYLQGVLKDIDFTDSSSLESKISELNNKKITRLFLINSSKNDNSNDKFIELLQKNGIQIYRYSPDSEIKEQIELFESIFDSNKQGNISILYGEISTTVIELAIKIVLYNNPNLSVEEVYTYFSSEELDIVTINEFKEYIYFLENDPYILTKPDRREFNRNKPQSKTEQTVSEKSSVVEESQSNTAFTLNLNSLKTSNLDDEKLLTETQKMDFNLNSLIESDFEKEESPEEHYEKLKNTARVEVEDSLSLDVDLSDEIEYISSLESLIPPSKDKISIVEINTVPLEEIIESSKIPNATIDYTNKQFIDFDAIIEDEIEQGIISEELGLNVSSTILDDSFPKSIDFDDIISEKNTDSFSLEEHFANTDANSAINLDIMDTKANIDLSFPPPIPDLEDLLDGDIQLKADTSLENDHLVDPSQTFMVKRINDVIKKEVLNEESKGKIPVSDLVKVDTKSEKSISDTPDPTQPKISSPKFNPIQLDD